MRMRAFFSTSVQTDVAFIFSQNWNLSLNFLCKISDIMIPTFLTSCAWKPSSVLQLRRMLPSFSFKISRSGGISFVKSVISWCLILSNHAHESLLQYSPSNGYYLHFPHLSLDVDQFALQNKSCQDAEKCRLIKMSELLILKNENYFLVEDVSFLTIHAGIIAHNNWGWHIAHMWGMIYRKH